MQCGTHVWHTCCFISVYSFCALDMICMHTDTVYSFHVAIFGLLVFACASALLKETQVGGVTGNIMFPQSFNLDWPGIGIEVAFVEGSRDSSMKIITKVCG